MATQRASGLSDLADLAPGLRGYLYRRTERIVYLPVISNENEGDGAVGRFLEELKVAADAIVVATVMNQRLQGMLERRDFHPELHYTPLGQVACMVWRRPEPDDRAVGDRRDKQAADDRDDNREPPDKEDE